MHNFIADKVHTGRPGLPHLAKLMEMTYYQIQQTTNGAQQ